MVRWFGQIFVTLLTLSFPAALSLPQQPLIVQSMATAPRRVAVTAIQPKVQASAVAAIDGSTGALLLAQAADTPLPLASLTKLMTALVVVENQPDWPALVTIQASDQRSGGQVVLEPGERVSRYDVFQLMLVASSNEAAVSLARSTGLSHQAFVAAMHRKAIALGLSSLRFVDVAGLEAGNAGTARDVARLGQAALRYPEILEAVQRQSYAVTIRNTGETRRAAATNQLFELMPPLDELHVVGGKTGYLDEVGYNYFVAFMQDGHAVSLAFLGVPTAEARWQESLRVGHWIFANYRWPRSGEERPLRGG